MFLSVGRDPQRDDQAVFPDVDAIEKEPDEIEAIERLRLPRFELRTRLGDESAAHRALARATTHDRRWHRFQTASVLTRRDPDQHLLDDAPIQRIVVGKRLKGWQR